jgi:hypothetical protein
MWLTKPVSILSYSNMNLERNTAALQPVGEPTSYVIICTTSASSPSIEWSSIHVGTESTSPENYRNGWRSPQYRMFTMFKSQNQGKRWYITLWTIFARAFTLRKRQPGLKKIEVRWNSTRMPEMYQSGHKMPRLWSWPYNTEPNRISYSEVRPILNGRRFRS